MTQPGMDQLSSEDLKISRSCRMLVVSPPQMGKSFFCHLLVKNRQRLFENHHTKIIYCSPHFTNASVSDQEFMQKIREAAGDIPVLFLDHMISWEELAMELSPDGAVLCIVDDLALEASSSPTGQALFTRISSHQNCDVVMTCHSASFKENGRYFSTIFGSCNYLCLMRNLADALSLSRLSSKCFPGQGNVISRMMTAANQLFGNHAHLLLDFSAFSTINHKYMARSNIFTQQQPPYVLLFKNPID